jgi:endonuclease YncB( thermonuclease family)
MRTRTFPGGVMFDMKLIEAAESAARAEKLGIWSDAVKEERQSEGYS